MKKILFVVIILLVGSTMAFAAPIDLSTGWSQQGNPGNGNWVVSSDGSNVLQTINGYPTYFVSDANYIDTTFEGSFGVETTGDDDFIGFVFGFTGLDNFYLFDWKQSSQNYAPEGYTLSRISEISTSNNFWTHTGPGITVLDTDYGSNKGWADNTVYNFSLDYSTSNITIKIDGNEIFNVDGIYETGRFGFYNYSQSQVRYQGFEEDQHPVPEPSTILLMALGLLGLVGYGRKRKIK